MLDKIRQLAPEQKRGAFGCALTGAALSMTGFAVGWALTTAAVGSLGVLAAAAVKAVQRGVDDPAGAAQ